MKEAGSTLLDRPVPAAILRWEGPSLLLVAWALLLAIPLSLGEVALSWDAVNHHIYLGWTAEQHRFGHDFLGAGYQSFQSPYLYWPFYKMAVSGWNGVSAGVVVASLHVIVVWPVWMMARACLPGASLFDLGMRAVAVALAFMSSVVLSAVTTSMNDVLAATPLVWAVALAIEPLARDMPAAKARRFILLSGLAAGLSVALKLSNGPLAVCMPALWLLCRRELRARLVAAVIGSAGVLAGFLLGYGHWGWLLWKHFGNPIYPFHHFKFTPLRDWLGWVG